MDAAAQEFHPRTYSIKLWPPSASTRTMLIEKMTKNLCSESIFSRKYGLLRKEEAYENAKLIEEQCFAAASEHFQKEPDGDGSSAVQFYAKETSKLMMEVLKRGPESKDNGEIAATIGLVTKPSETVFDISGGRRAFIEGEEVRQLLSPLIVQGNSYTKICLSNRSFGIDAAHVAGPILASVKEQLTEVNLSDFVAGRPEDDALEVMKIFSSALEGCNLRYLNLSDNALGEKGVRAFGALLKSQNSLEELYLMNDGISEEAAKAICELIPSTDKLKILHFHNNMTGDEGAIAISELLKHSPIIEDFRCSSTRVGSEGGIELAKALKSCSHLKRIDIRDNIFGVDAGLALSKTLEKLVHIKEIYLSYLNLEDEGTIAIANALKESVPSLEVLDIAGNEITPKAAPALAECIAVKSSLTKLVLSENELKDQGVILISKVLEEGHAQLKELDLSNNMIRRVGARCLAQAVSNKPDFKLLNINGNEISDEGIDEVKEILKNGKNSLDVLGPLDENDVEGEGGYEGNEDDVAEDDEGELGSKLQHLKVEQE
ncbi:RAN GTPase-activating protein 2-like [Canna indica]|uniref:RAN GTPase-activating protein 2-like n=1 Tax=Canna indica TaxID=4628 RepID=A0AAQ3QIK2_9LILI|nr:RAN GTPase-activating protein 2-like [Canna indica]